MNRRKAALIGLFITVVWLAVMGVSQAQEFGTNWSGTFFPQLNFQGSPTAVTGINGLNFNWSNGIPSLPGSSNSAPLGTQATNYSVRFSSTQNFAAGAYTFTAGSDDGVRLIVDGNIVLDKFVGRPFTTDTVTVNLTAGPHQLTVEYFQSTAAAQLQVQWALTGALATAGPSPTPGPTNTPLPTGLPAIPSGAVTATVIRASTLIVRESPSVYSPKVGRILRGQTYQVIGRDAHARWFLLQLSGFRGWVLGYYVYVNGNEFNPPVTSGFALAGNPASATGVVALSYATLKLRAQPTVYSAQIGRVTWGGAVGVVGRTRAGDWWQVVWKGTTGWVASGYLKITEGKIENVPIVQP
jgi:uncharacterized protein YgiM (DUF1202 family)